jgi:kanamycin kinase/aminoglycoside 3'-phosphotransferase-3
MEELYLPDKIKNRLNNMKFEKINIGLSRTQVYKFYSARETLYLKFGLKNSELKKEYENLFWLQRKIPVPEIIEWYSDNDNEYLITTEITGKMLCDDYYLGNPSLVISIMAEGIKLFQSVDIKDCPINNNLDIKLEKAKFNLQNNLVYTVNWEKENKFASPNELLVYMIDNKPKDEELVFTHGDYCLPNILGNENKLMGFVDIGSGGMADKWQDIAIGIRSIRQNFHTNEYDEAFLKQIGIVNDPEKLEYYIFLYEFF